MAYGERCGGFGVINCYCGGDQCYCTNNGEYDCLGCPDCEGGDGEFEDEDYYDDEEPCE